MKQIAVVATLLLMVFGAAAKPVGPATTRLVAEHLLGQAVVDATSAGVSEYHLYLGANGSGFALLSADDCAAPVLAYSEDGHFPVDLETMPPHVAAWVEGYRSEIAAARRLGLQPSPGMAARWQQLLDGAAPKNGSAVEPLVNTAWGQGSYYNAQCPAGMPAGCVAVAMAQVMRYWGHPSIGRGSHAYYSHAAGDTLRAHFGATAYRWSSMPDALSAASSSVQVDAVAQLIAHVGIALDMQYAAGSSIAYMSSYAAIDSASAESALRQHFNYHPALHSAFKQEHTDSSWRALASAELDAGRPIIYAGHGTASHAFVVDGYDRQQLFHVNWGWDGLYNGYYNLDTLFIDIPGGTAALYNRANEMLVGIEPATPSSMAYTLSGASAAPAMGSVSGSGTVASDSLRASLMATAAEGYILDRWSSGAINNPRLYSPTADLADTAHFRPLAGDTIAYCRPFGYDWYTTPADGTLTWGIRIPASLIPRHRKLHQVQLYTVDPGTYHIRVYTGHERNSVLHAEDYQFDTPGWQTVTLADPSITVYNTAPVWITVSVSGVQCATQRSLYTGNPDGAWLLDGDTWRPSHEVDGTYGTWMLRALFAENDRVTLTLRCNDGSWGSVTGGGTYFPGDTATIEATAFTNCQFDSWSDGSTDNPYSFVIESDLTITALFSPNNGIGDTEPTDGLSVALHGLTLTVDNPQRRHVALYDVAGRQLVAPTDEPILTLDLPMTGLFLLQADGLPARRIVAIKH